MGGWKPFDHLCTFVQELDTKVEKLEIEVECARQQQVAGANK